MSSKRAGIKRRRQHSAELKARVALEAIQERRTINEIAAEYGVHPTQVSAWKRQAVESLSAFFDGGVRVDGHISTISSTCSPKFTRGSDTLRE